MAPNVILCTKSMQIEFSHLVHINCIFLLSIAEIILVIELCFINVCHLNFSEKNNN